jgi:hypothetical protein
MASPREAGLQAEARRYRPALVIVGLLAATLCISLMVWAWWPRYIVLSIPPPAAHGWYYTAKTVTRWADDGATYYLWRVETSVYTDEGPFQTRADITNYLHEWLVSRGWRIIPRGSLACRNALPDVLDLAHDTDVTTYFLPAADEVDPYFTPVTCILIRPIGYSIDGFHVVLVTEQMSPTTLFIRSWD